MSQSVNDLRRAFIQYFEQQGHRAVPSAPLIPQADPTLLFTNAGMNQFKRVFLGEETRAYNRAVTVQKCLRAGGKHNDLENVGYTRRHHTFFEMLGNFSFGDYFKEEAIRFGWEFLTSVVGLSKDRMWITIFREGRRGRPSVAKDRRLPEPHRALRREGQFLADGGYGPLRSLFRLHFDQGPSVPGDATPNGEGDRVIEIWNLVFMQFNRDSAGTLNPLPKPSIDTGMGLERLTAVAQGAAQQLRQRFVLRPCWRQSGPGPERSTVRWNKRIVPCASSPITCGPLRSSWPTGSCRRTRGGVMCSAGFCDVRPAMAGCWVLPNRFCMN
jgi:alanyl-tRNA synthetase